MKEFGADLKLPAEKVCWKCNPEKFPFETTAEVEPLSSVIGQERALKAIEVGLKVKNPGFNIFVAGMTGTGKTSTIRRLLEQMESRKATLTDKLYVHNFKTPDCPRAIILEAGEGARFKRDMKKSIEFLKARIPLVLQGEDFKRLSENVVKEIRDRGRRIVNDFNERIKQDNFVLIQYQVGPMTRQDLAPLVDGQPLSMEDLEKAVAEERISAEDAENYRQIYVVLKSEMDRAMRQARILEKEIKETLEQEEIEHCRSLVTETLVELRERYPSDSPVEYLQEVQENILANLDKFKEEENKQQMVFPGFPAVSSYKDFSEYEVNLLVDNSDADKSPVIIENIPSYKNLFGMIEREVDRSGYWRSDFTMIKAGALLRADGGYLVINALDALTEPGVWRTLKRILKTRQIEIQNYDPYSLSLLPALKPQAIDLDVKVIMIGDNSLYYLLLFYDEDFQKVFKVKADFAPRMDLAEEQVNAYAGFIRMLCDKEKMMPFHRSAVARVVEYGVRAAGRQDKLTARFAEITDVLREANYYAVEAGGDKVTAEHVQQALTGQIERVNLLEDRVEELMEEGLLVIKTEGEEIGQVNGLSVLSLGNYYFGRPTRITAEIGVGRSGVINIEREAKLSGKTHDKGVFILEGFLRGRYGRQQPLNMSAGICFEQSYGGIDGDSASAAEAIALISSLSMKPVRQDIAITGSIDQKGNVQAIGGVNEKIEGFFKLCSFRGLTDNQGVIIPQANVRDLMLKQEVVEAVADGKFSIYSVTRLDEAMEIMIGMKVGNLRKDGKFQKNSLNRLVVDSLEELSQKAKESGNKKKEHKKKKEEPKPDQEKKKEEKEES